MPAGEEGALTLRAVTGGPEANIMGNRRASLGTLGSTVVLATIALVVGAVPLVQPSGPTPLGGGALAVARSSLKATFLDIYDWGTGYVGEYEVTNVGTDVAPRWRLKFSVPAGSQLVNSWNGVVSVAGDRVSVTNASWDGTLEPGAAADFGFQVAYTGRFAPPTFCTVDGSPCAGGPGAGGPGTAAAGGGGKASGTTGPVSTRTTTTWPAPPPPGRHGPTQFAPYIDMTLQHEDLAAISSASGARTFTLAFVVSGGDCAPAWGGVAPVGSPADYVKGAIGTFRRGGGSVIISFGGEAGTELAESCPSVASLEAAYQKVADTYGVYDLDFDIEGAAVGDVSAVAMRSAALALLQRDEALLGHQVEVALTLPALPSGLPGAELAIVRSAVTAGVHLSIVDPMAMDYGDSATSPGQMGTHAVDAARAVEKQLASIYPTDRAAKLWAMVGITPMIGQNDVSNEVFTLSDAGQLAQFAAQAGTGRLSMWSVTRDQQCPQGVIHYDSPTCSGVLQTSWAFSHILEAG